MSALIIVDIQNDFLIGGYLEMPNNPNSIIEPINQLQMNHKFDKIIITQHVYPTPLKNKKPSLVAGTVGAELSHKLHKSNADLIITKQTYSAFDEKKVLYEYLTLNKIRSVYICGLAYDCCVGETAIDAIGLGFETFIVRDLTKSYRDSTEKNMNDRITALDIKLILLKDICTSLPIHNATQTN